MKFKTKHRPMNTYLKALDIRQHERIAECGERIKEELEEVLSHTERQKWFKQNGYTTYQGYGYSINFAPLPF